MVKCCKAEKIPESLAKEKLKGVNGSCTCKDVVDQLTIDFHNKCYICEIKGVPDPEVEHLHPHHNGMYLDLKFDWSNLFLSCSHCNMIKNQSKYENTIIDCCKEDPEIHIKSVYHNGNVSVTSKDGEEASLRTAELIYETFNRDTPALRNIASQYRLNALRLEMVNFFKELNAYGKNPQKRSHKKKLAIMLDRSSAFASFKREYIRDHSSTYKELFGLLSM